MRNVLWGAVTAPTAASDASPAGAVTAPAGVGGGRVHQGGYAHSFVA